MSIAERSSHTPRGTRRVEGLGLQSAVNDRVSSVNEAEIVVSGVMAKPSEGLFHVEPGPLCYYTFGLFDDNTAAERMVELLVHKLGLAGGPVVKDRDGGDISQSLGGYDVTLLHRTLMGPEKAEGTDSQAA